MNENTKQPPEAKLLTPADGWFTANGKRYYISQRVSIRRWKEYEKLVPRITYGMDFDSINKNLLRVYNALNDKKFADAAVWVHNMLSAIKDANDDSRIHPVMAMAALIINEEGEDVAEYDENKQREKIKDWEKEGLAISDFFHIALTAISGFKTTYISFIREQAAELVKTEGMQPAESSSSSR